MVWVKVVILHTCVHDWSDLKSIFVVTRRGIIMNRCQKLGGGRW